MYEVEREKDSPTGGYQRKNKHRILLKQKKALNNRRLRSVARIIEREAKGRNRKKLE